MFNWESDDNEVMINPRFSNKEMQEVLAMLKQSPALKGHVWMATTGTSGHFKWAALSKSAILTSAHAVNTFLHSTNTDVWVNPLPGFHVGGLGIQARGHLSRAAVVDAFSALQGKWDPLQFYKLLCESKGSLTSLVPAQAYDLASLQLQAPPSLRAVIVGGGALQEPLYHRAIALGWNLLPSYGLTECCSQVATARLDDKCKDSMPPLRLLPHMEAEIQDSGCIKVKSPSLLSLYALKTPEGTRFIDPKIDGWFLTEDVGQLKGRDLKVQGRVANFIKIGGESVDLLRLERILEEIRLEAGCKSDMALVPMPDERLGHVIHLAVATEDKSHIQGIVDKFQVKTLPFEKIRQVHYLDKIPRSPMSKLLMKDLLTAVLK